MRPLADTLYADWQEWGHRPWPHKLDKAYDAANQRRYAVPTWQFAQLLWRADSPAKRKQKHLDHFAGGAR